MGKEWFVPRCKFGYKTCTEKVYLLAAPREADHLKIWRHAIPRKEGEALRAQVRDEDVGRSLQITRSCECTTKGGSDKRRRADEVYRPPCSLVKDRKKKKGACGPFAPSCHQT
ncbi:hypothetical protein HPB49_008217 [Dermacentor silvarum]|uniref:Uncharacterized protein n=1 Tax=Dermacentor silvarum TaxID=543639 RepID=A0ACB8DIV8_DERSI|nr:hypothetical protein HPB49_008217 [Dermacentor silvarum]